MHFMSISVFTLRRVFLTLLAGAIFAVSSIAKPPETEMARQEIEAALTQLGGKAALMSLSRVTTTGLTVQNLLEQSVRFEGPYVQNLFDFEETCNFDTLEHRVTTRIRGAQFADWFTAEYTFGFREGITRKGMSLTQTPQESAERLTLAPERLLLLAERAPDLRFTGETLLNKTPHRRIQFTANATKITVFLNRYSHLPTVVESVGVRQGFWQIWGDVTTRVEYSNYQLLPGGWCYPFCWTVQRNGLLQSTTTLTHVKFSTTANRGSEAVSAEFAAMQDALQKPHAPRVPTFPEVTVAEGIFQFPGMFNTQVIVQSDGLLVVEAINNSSFNEALIAELTKQFPDKKIKGVIVTDDAWPHCGGIRPYIARGIPLYALLENRTILERLTKAPFTLMPDAQQTVHRPLRLITVTRPLTIGDGPNRCQIIPLRGNESERMVAVYFPERKLLYGSDLIQIGPDGKLYSAELVQELKDMVVREKLTVETVFAMHSGPISWQSLLTTLDASKEENKPKSN